jgi:pyruvate-formate lyase-activating enzyme
LRKLGYLEDIHLKNTAQKEFKKKPLLSLEKVIDLISPLSFKKIIFLGGEPTVDPKIEFILQKLKGIFQAKQILLTNGSILIERKFLDEICFSLKALSEDLHLRFTGQSNRELLENFKRIAKEKVPFLRAESIFIPGYIDEEEIERIARFISEINSEIPYRVDAFWGRELRGWRSPTRKEMEEVLKRARQYLKNVTCLYGDEKVKYPVKKIY